MGPLSLSTTTTSQASLTNSRQSNTTWPTSSPLSSTFISPTIPVRDASLRHGWPVRPSWIRLLLEWIQQVKAASKRLTIAFDSWELIYEYLATRHDEPPDIETVTTQKWASANFDERPAFKSMGGITIAAGLFTALFGILYGEIFGLHLIATHFWTVAFGRSDTTRRGTPRADTRTLPLRTSCGVRAEGTSKPCIRRDSPRRIAGSGQSAHRQLGRVDSIVVRNVDWSSILRSRTSGRRPCSSKTGSRGPSM